MKRYLQLALLPVPIGLAIGLLAAATVIDTQPPFLGWVIGSGLGLMGGSFLAAIASGDALVGGPAPKRGSVGDAPWLAPQRDRGEDDDR